MVLVCKKVKKLKHLLVKSVYYKLLNTSYIFTLNAWNYCRCDQFQGCRFKPRNLLESGERYYWYICRVEVTYHSERIEKLTKIADIVNNTLEIKKDIQLCIDIDPSCENVWMYHYKASWKIVLVFVNGNILKIILIVMIFVLMIIEIRIKCLTIAKKRVVIYTINFFFLSSIYLWPFL